MKTLKMFLIIVSILFVTSGIGMFSDFSMASNSNEEANKLIDIRKKENNGNNVLNAGYGMKSLNRAPVASFEQSSDKNNVEVTIEDGKGFKSIKRRIGTSKETFKTIKIDEKAEKVQKDTFKGPKEGIKKQVTYVITDATGLKSTTKCVVSNKDNTYKFDSSMRVSFSYSDNNLHLILKDMGGITTDKASIEVFDYNTSNKKSVVKLSGNNIKIDKDSQVEYPEKSGKIVYGVYSLPLNKLNKDKAGKYFIKVKTTDCSGIIGYRMAEFEVESSVNTSKTAQVKRTKAKDSNTNTTKTAKTKESNTDSGSNTDNSNNEKYVAQIGKKKYKTLEEAIKAVNKSGKKQKIKLLKDIKIEDKKSIYITDESKIVLDLNKHNIKGGTLKNAGNLTLRGEGSCDNINNLHILKINKNQNTKIKRLVNGDIKRKSEETINSKIIKADVNGGYIGKITNIATCTLGGNAKVTGNSDKYAVSNNGGKLIIKENARVRVLKQNKRIFSIYSSGKVDIENSKKVKSNQVNIEKKPIGNRVDRTGSKNTTKGKRKENIQRQ